MPHAAAFKTILVSTVAGRISASVSPGLPATAQTVTYGLQYDSADFDTAEAECQKSCSHLAAFTSLREQVGGDESTALLGAALHCCALQSHLASASGPGKTTCDMQSFPFTVVAQICTHA